MIIMRHIKKLMNNFIELLKMVSFPIHKEGYRFIIIFSLATFVLLLFSDALGLIGIVLTLWCIFFFRDPERFTPNDDSLIISPADGVVTRVEYDIEAPAELGLKDKKVNKIVIFLNVFNVHVNRVIASGEVLRVDYKPGKFLSANVDEASTENERNIVVMKTAAGKEVAFVQVAGLVARRIVSDIKVGQKIKAGDRYGIIRFGSRADIYLPTDIKIKILVGQTMIGGETVIAKQ